MEGSGGGGGALSEFKSWWALAWPVSLASMARMGMHISDLAIVGHLQSDPKFPTATNVDFLGCTALAMTWMSFTSAVINMGLGAALSTLCSQAIGASNPRLCGVWLQCCLLVTAIACVPIAFAWYNTNVVVSAFVGADVCGELCFHLTGKFSRYSLMWLVPQALFTIGTFFTTPCIFLTHTSEQLLSGPRNCVPNSSF
jgi:MATE family multidrug resistance protein